MDKYKRKYLAMREDCAAMEETIAQQGMLIDDLRADLRRYTCAFKLLERFVHRCKSRDSFDDLDESEDACYDD